MRASLLFCILSFISVSVRAQYTDIAHANFTQADSIADLYSGFSLKDLRKLSYVLTTHLFSEEEKFRAIYKWVCNNIDYDYFLFLQHKQKENKFKTQEEIDAWNKKFSARVFKNLVSNHKTVCTGYAYLVRELANHAGLNCKIIDGYGRTTQANIRGAGNANHSWNAVRLNNKWYLCDATWSSGAFDAGLNYIKKFDESYFLSDPAIFVRNHYPLDSAWMLLNHKQTLKEFLNGPLIYSAAFQYHVNPKLPAAFDVTVSKGQPVLFQFTKLSNSAIEKTELYVKGPRRTDLLPIEFSRDKNGVCSAKHSFETKGTHIVHILINNCYALTYTVNVQ